MTWRPQKRNYLLPTQRPSSASPLISASDDADLDFSVQKLIYVENTVRKMLKEMKRYLSAIESLDEADRHLTTNLINYDLVHVSDDFRKIVQDYHSVTNDVGKSVQKMIPLFKETFIEPLKKLREEFAIIAAELVKREELVTMWKESYFRLRKTQEKRDKTASYVARLEKDKDLEESAGKKLKAFHSELQMELKVFLVKRLDYIKPSVHALIMIQLDHYGSMTNAFKQPNSIFTNSNSSDSMSTTSKISDDDYQQSIIAQVNRIKALTIVKDH